MPSCGCSRINGLTGKRFAKLVVIEAAGRTKRGNVLWRCKCDCGGETVTKAGHLASGETTSCGCNKNPKGPLNPLYKHDLPPEYRARMRGRKMVRWRKAVFERDGYTCHRCGAQGGTVNAHHIEGFSRCVEARTDIENGITLCASCHRAYHWLYGKNAATVKTLARFMLCGVN